MSSRIRIIALFLLLVFSAAGNVVWGYDVEWAGYSSTNKGDYYKSYTASDGSIITVSSTQSLSSSSGDIYLQLSGTPSNAGGSPYIEISSNGASIVAVEFLLTGNGENKSCQPAILVWSESVQTTVADTALLSQKTTVSNKGLANAQWFAFDLTDTDCQTLRFYRTVKGVNAPPFASGTTIGNGQTVQVYGVRVTLSTGEVVNRLIWSGNLRDGSTVTKYIDDLADFTYTASSSLGATCTIRYSSSNSAVATVNATTGQVHPTGVEGEAVITATQQACGETAAATATYTLRVMEEPLIDCSGSTVNWSESSTTSLHLPGGTYSKNNKTYYAPGVYMDTTEYYPNGCPKKILILTLGCDTTVQLCVGDTYTWDRNGVTYDTKGDKETMSYKVHMPNGKDYTYTIKLKITQPSTAVKTYSDTKVTITPGSSYHWFGKDYTEQGIYEDVIRNAAGCDSIGTLTLGVCKETPDVITTKIIINEGASYYWKYTDTKYTQSAFVQKDTTNEFGCPVIMQLDLTVQKLSDADEAYSMCEGDVYEWRGLTITEAGKYTAADGTGTTLHVGVLPQPGVNACDDKIISYDESVQLSASGADYYKWWPTDSLEHQCLSSTWDAQPIATPLLSTMYHVKSYNSADKNSVINGNFEFGPSGAASGKVDESNLPAGAVASYITDLWYTRNDRKFGTHNISQKSGELFGKSDKYPDHTKGDGSGWYMVIDGFNRADTPNDSILWQQIVDVTPGLDYIFSAWFVSLNSSSPAQLQFCVNGKPLGDVRFAPSTVNDWTRYYELWANDDGLNKATLTITNLNPNGDGNDFGLDDISFQALGPCFGEDSVKVTINFDIHLYPQQDDPNTMETRTKEQVDNLESKGVKKYETKFVNQTMPVGGSTATTFNYGTGYYSYGDQLTVTAHNGEDDCFGFVRWEDGETSPTRTYTVGVDDVGTITPIYGKKKFNVIIRSNDAESGKVAGKIE